MTKSKKKKSPASARRTGAPSRPWVIDGVDYGPAINAVADLATWAFDLAARDVEGWPEGRRRVLAARGYVLSRMRGKGVRHAPSEDVLFTAGLLARIFEADLELGMTEMVSILDQLGLPTEVVPLMPRAQRTRRNASNVLPFPSHRRAVEDQVPVSCPGCIYQPRLRNAA